MKANTRKSSKPRRKPPSNAGLKRPTKVAREMAKPIEVEPVETADTERSPAAWARLIDSLVEQRATAADRLAGLRAKLAPLVLSAEIDIRSGATGALQKLRLDVNQTANRITELDDAIQLARVELSKAEDRAAAAGRAAAKAELEEVHESRMLLAGMIDECLETLGELVRQWDASKFQVTSVARRIHGSEGDDATSIGRQLFQGSRRAMRHALWHHAPELCDLTELPREPARWRQSLATGEVYLSSRMLKDSDVDRFERSLQVESPSDGPKESREEVVARLKRPVDEGELRLAAVRQGVAEETAEKVEPEADEDDSNAAEVAAQSGFEMRG